MFDSMRYHNNNNKNTFNILTTSSTIHRTEPNIKLINSKKNNKNIKVVENKKYSAKEGSESKMDTGMKIGEKKDKFIQNMDLNNNKENFENEKNINNNILFKKTNKDMINFGKYLDSSKNHINSISISSDNDKQIIKSKYDEVMKSHNNIIEKGSKNDSSYNNELYYNNYISDNSKNENQKNERLIDGEFNEEESHNSFIQALNMWRKERNDQKNKNLNNDKKNKFEETFNENYNIKNASETQTKELAHSLNIDEIVKNIQNSKSNLSYMDRLALYKYREQYKKNMEANNKITVSNKDYEITEIDEDEIDAEVEKYWENNLNNESNDDKEIENNINTFVNQYKMNQIALRNNSNKYDNNNENIFNTKTSVYIDDSYSDDDNEINDFSEISPLVREPEEA
ncbi:hypothetical protein LY90DRAFT_516480 [Neocallimastix californiae]|uniref:Uncharacterized protein n=1 Tax=Neocallimastix californiae TaxID=1754190 RepID=A0A1Y2AFQ9_9FUNG|nr:hypothetical protein LY90DRAFT_516480 [Neocallimastix californiae]|eukprot:ORY20795.1 hypothetical protein LY90DRAFT_516480 [Neocallimastix californiae]